MMQPAAGVGPPIPQATDQQQWIMPVQQPIPQLEQPQVAMPQHHQQYHIPQSHDEVRSLWVGDLQYWMDENYLRGCFYHTGEVLSVKIIRNRQTMASEGYGFVEFTTHAAAERILQTYNATFMPQTEQPFRLNWACSGLGERRPDASPEHSIFVGDLAPDVNDYLLQETFRLCYTSVKGAKVVMDSNTGRSKGYGFVRFGDENERARAMNEMNGVYCASRPMRISAATPRRSLGLAQQYNTKAVASYGTPAQSLPSDNDLNNTTIFVGGLDPNVTDEDLKLVFGQIGEVVYVKIPHGKGCGFVQFAHRSSAEEALQKLHGSVIGQQTVRLSWGRSYPNRQRQPTSWTPIQPDPNQWNAGYYGYGQGYEAYGYVPPPQNAGTYVYGGYPAYASYPPQVVGNQQM